MKPDEKKEETTKKEEPKKKTGGFVRVAIEESSDEEEEPKIEEGPKKISFPTPEEAKRLMKKGGHDFLKKMEERDE